MTLTNRAVGVGTAGFVLSRLLLEPPSRALAEHFGNPQMRGTWPLDDADSRTALDSLGADLYEDLLEDHTALSRVVSLQEAAWRADEDPARLHADLVAAYEAGGLRPLPADDHVGHQVALLAHLATRLVDAGAGAGAGAAETARAAALASQELREAHLDRVIGPILDGIARQARTRLYRAVPGLVRGFLAADRALCAVVLDGLT
ncbi:hypothetical protein [Georgenia yuyongxinii]|uniref:Uncharacterized protein n=1 Tax=Georgenia yuyongxinii TaxID=2589797 RepID=A0A552WPN1_9MICO|nr:hypothetical protein [Georgenia yuyongxinii]TRW44726.1 hypothetical protein FJ693_12505 [Georgenia yuyongxinii]